MLVNPTLLLLVCLLTVCTARLVTISNSLPRTDSSGAIMDMHDGKIIIVNGVYHWYAASYGDCKEPSGDTGCKGAAPGSCGFQLNHNVSLFTSTDLQLWENQGHVLQMEDVAIPDAVLFCPKVVFNRRSGKFVMWFNWIAAGDFSQSYYAVLISQSPLGPFQLVSKKVPMAFSDTGDFNLFVDDDDKGYAIYTSHIVGYNTTHRISVELLADDYCSSLLNESQSGFFGDSFVEAPAMFKRDKIYYAVFGQCCCYCKSGSPVTVYTALHPLGPWAKQNQIGFSSHCKDDSPISRTSAMFFSPGFSSHLQCNLSSPFSASVGAQQSDIFPWKDSDGVLQFMYYGDRWQSSPDGVKSHDFTYFFPLRFAIDGNVTAMETVENFQIDI